MNLQELSIKAPIVNADIKTHVFVCTGASCSNNESQATLEKFWEVLKSRELLYGKRGSKEGTVLVTTCGSMGFCATGPAVLIYPEGVWYHSVQAQDVEELVDKHILEGKVVERLLGYRMG